MKLSNKGEVMKIIINPTAKSLGFSEANVLHMLKACDKKILTDEYEPTVQELADLAKMALSAEQKRKRVVLEWASLVSELQNLLK